MSAPAQVTFFIALLLMSAEVLELVYRFLIKRDVMLTRQKYSLLLTITIILIGVTTMIHFIMDLSYKDLDDHKSFSFMILALIYFLMVRFIVEQADTLKLRAIEILETVVGIIEAGDPNLRGHSLHVQNLTILFYDYLSPSYKFQINETDLKLASLFIDLGKLGIPRNILEKSGKLSDEEYALIKNHPESGAKILHSIGGFDKITDWVLYHHERYNGSGYHGLKGKEIPLASRIIAVADTYSALIMDRSYKASMTHEDAIAELRMVAGSQLDEELVEIFCTIPKSKVNQCLINVNKKMDILKFY